MRLFKALGLKCPCLDVVKSGGDDDYRKEWWMLLKKCKFCSDMDSSRNNMVAVV
jgi:hypothetical protein